MEKCYVAELVDIRILFFVCCEGGRSPFCDLKRSRERLGDIKVLIK